MIFSIARETFKTVCSSNNLPVILPPKGIPSILPNGNVETIEKKHSSCNDEDEVISNDDNLSFHDIQNV